MERNPLAVGNVRSASVLDTQMLADRELIRETYGRMIYALDHNDGVSFADCFAVGGILWSSGRPEKVGRRALAEYIEASAVGRPIHVLTSVVRIDVQGDDADGRVAFALMDPQTGELYVRGNSDATLSCTTDRSRWEYTRLAFTFDWASPRYLTLGRGSLGTA